MTLPLFHRLNLIFTFALMGCSLTQAADPLEKLAAYWESNFDKESNSEARQARFVGYLEGALNIDVPQWWRNNWISSGSNGVSTNDNWILGSHPTDSLKSNGDTFTVRGGSRNELSMLVKRAGSQNWEVTVTDLYLNVYGKGPEPADYSIVLDGELLYIFGRDASMRFIVALSVDTGAKLGHFAYFKDDPEDFSKRHPYGATPNKK